MNSFLLKGSPCQEELAGEIMLNNMMMLSNLGSGSYGNVYLVESKRSKEVYALKIRKKARIFPNNQAASTLIYFENFFQERNIHLKANHLTNYVAKLFATFQNNSYVFYFMQFEAGGSLKQRISNNRLLDEQIQAVFLEVSLGLCYLHEAGIVHRDIKPENILVSSSGHCRITDFNLALDISNEGFTNKAVGTVFYQAPEIHLKYNYDYAVDFWSLGVTLYELITQNVPYITPYLMFVPSHDPLRENIYSNVNVSKSLKLIINRLFQRTPAKRRIFLREFSEQLIKQMNENPIDYHLNTKVKKLEEYRQDSIMTDVYLSQLDERPLLDLNKFEPRGDFENRNFFKGFTFVTREFIETEIEFN